MTDVIEVQLPEPLDEVEGGVTAAEYEAGWFDPMPVEDEPVLLAGFCNVCGHAVYRQGYDFICTEKCHCVMIGCVRRPEDRT